MAPSRVAYVLFELSVSLQAVVEFADVDALAAVGMVAARYGELSYAAREREYPRSQEVGEACAFLGADGLLVPSARNLTRSNLIVFCEQSTDIEKAIVRDHGQVSFR